MRSASAAPALAGSGLHAEGRQRTLARFGQAAFTVHPESVLQKSCLHAHPADSRMKMSDGQFLSGGLLGSTTTLSSPPCSARLKP